MEKRNFWFKFEWDDWLGDDELAACTLETQGFWIRCIATMRRKNVSEFVGSIDQLRRKFGVLPEELTRCLLDLKNNNAADVRFGKDDVSIKSRRIERELKDKENNRLYVSRHRAKDECKDDVSRQSKSKSKSKSKKKEEEREEAASPPSPPFGQPSKFDHPAVVLFEETFGFKVGTNFAMAVNKITDLAVWADLVKNKSAFADRPLEERRRVCNWILDEYDKRVENKQNGTSQKSLTAAERNWERTVANEQLGEDLRTGKLDGLLDELHRRDPLYRHEIAPPSQPSPALTGGFDDHGEGLDGLSEADHPGAPFS